MADKFEKMNKPNNIEIKTEIKNLALIKFLGEISKSTSKPVVISQIINTKYLYEILTEADYDYFFKNLNFTFDKSIGILNTEITEIISFLIKYVEKVCPELNHEFNNLKNINVANLLKKDSSEIDKLVDLLIISILNCNNKESFIDKLLNMEEYVQQEILNIIEIYVNVDERESIKNTMNKSIHKGGFMFSTNFNQENDESIANINQIHQNLEFSMLNSEVNRLKQENTELKMFIELHEDNIRELDKKVLTLSIENKNLETENIRMSNELKTKNKDISTEIKQKIENLEALLKSKDLENKKLTLNYENKLQEKQAELSKQLDIIDNLKNKLANSEQDKGKFQFYENKVKEVEHLKEKILYYESYIKNDNVSVLMLNQKNLENELIDKNNYIENLESNIRELQIELSKAPQINEAKNLNDSHISCKTAEVAKYNHRQIIENLNYVSIKQNTDSYNSPSKKTNNLEFDATTIKKKTYSQKSLEDSPHKKKHSKIRFNLESNDNLMSIDINEYNEMDSRGRDQYSINTYDNNNNRDFEILKMNYNDKCSELELLKKSFVELKEQYENEFEMMASSIYSLGIQFLNVKQDYAKKSQDNPNWLTRQRLKMFNGDM